MGGSSSSQSAVTQEQSNYLINTTTVNNLNALINSTTVNTVITNASTCAGSITQNQSANFGDITVGSGGNFTVSQEQTANLNFSCSQWNQIQTQMVNNMVDNITQAMQQNVSQSALAALQATAASQSQQGFASFPWGGSSSDSSVNSSIKNYVSSNSTTNLTNVIKNAVFANFTNSNYNECIANIINAQQISAGNVTVTGEGSNVAFTQQQAASQLTNCIQNSGIANNITSDITRFLGIQVTQTTSQEAKSEAKITAEATAETAGVSQAINSIGGAISSVIEAPFKGLASLFGGAGALVSICCCLIIVVLIIFVLYEFGPEIMNYMGMSSGQEGYEGYSQGYSPYGAAAA